ncbi:12993_t:CDS:2, partial [Ambispora gerdemannii]
GRKRKQPIDDSTTTTIASTSKAAASTPTRANGNSTTSAAINNPQKKPKKNKITVDVNDDLKVKLLDDWEWITSQYQLLPLPKPKTVENILEDYHNHKIEENKKTKETNGVRHRGRGRPAKNPQEEILRENLANVKSLFNEVLGTQLLYRAERQQYFDFRAANSGADCSAYYGAEHLMRLLVILPRIVETTDMREVKAEQLRDTCQELISFLGDRPDVYFSEIYDNAPPVYIRLSENF